MGRHNSDLAILPTAGILATHYLHIYMPEVVSVPDKDQRITIDSLEEYLLVASPNLSLYAGLLGSDPFAGAYFINGSYGSFIGVQDSGTPSVGAYQENLSTGAVGQFTLTDGSWGVSVNDGGVLGYAIQDSFNASIGIRQLSLYDPVATITDEYGVSGGVPYYSLVINDSVTEYQVGINASAWNVWSAQTEFRLMNSDDSYYNSYPFVGSIVVDGFITVINGIYDFVVGAGNYTASMEYVNTDLGIDNLITVDATGVGLICASGSFTINVTAGGVYMTAANGGNETKLLVDSGGITVITHNSNTLLVDELTGNVRLYKAHNNSMAAGNAANPELRSGSDTVAPTVTATVNITGVASATNHKYLRVGNEIVGSFRVQIDPALGATPSQLRFTLPIASGLTLPGDVSGVAHCGSIDKGGEVTADVVNGAAYLDFISDAVAAAKTWTIFYQYTVK